MTTLTKRERVDAALRGEIVDRPPVSAWRHFVPEERAANTLAEAHLRFFHEYDWDWLKVNPRATYYAEAWGSQYDFDTYAGVVPTLVRTPLNDARDLAKITPLNPTEGVFAEHIELIERIKAGLGAAHAVQTVFSPLSVLNFLLVRPGEQAGEAQYDRLRALLHESPQAVHAALGAIAETLAGYAAANVRSGASGIFFAIVRLAREGALSPAAYAEFGRPYDLQVLNGVQDAPFNLLHICGPKAYFNEILDYPVHAINWASIGQDNPTLAEARGLTAKGLIGGIDEHEALQHGTPNDVIAAAHKTFAYAGRVGVLLSPGCGVAVDVPPANLHALRRAVEPTV